MIDDHSSRRAFCALVATAAATATIARAQGDDSIPIIDTHFHLYDQTRRTF